MSQVIEIKWKYDKQPAADQTPFKWSDALPAHTLGKTEAALGWPAGTMEILNKAFAAGASRFAPWDLESVAEKAPYLQAAKVFKRGVKVSRTPETTEVNSGSYQIRFADSPASILKLAQDNEAFCIVDAHVQKLWPDLLEEFPSMTLDERTKTLLSVANLQALWRQHGSLRHWTIIGGGILGDTAAFTAALLGCSFTLVPTTLLAMADACVGGKTGVNFPPFGKNQIGLFAYPREVLVSAGWLKTLPVRELRAGITECLKHASLSGNRSIIRDLSKETINLEELDKLLPSIIAVKANIVGQDPFESGLRATLNLGHTLGHALEALSHKANPQDFLLHGEAVAVGIIFAALLSHYHAGLTKEELQQIHGALQASRCLLSKAQLSHFLQIKLGTDEGWQNLSPHLASDKKALAGVRWVLLKALGHPLKEGKNYTVGVPESILAKSWQELPEYLPD